MSGTEDFNKRELGTEYEALARRTLREAGLEIIESNFRCRIGEIDIVAAEETEEFGRKVRYLVFVEVKYRSSRKQGGAAYAISASKQQTIRKVASYYLMKNNIPSDTLIRFDAVLIDGEEVTHIRKAWQ